MNIKNPIVLVFGTIAICATITFCTLGISYNVGRMHAEKPAAVKCKCCECTVEKCGVCTCK